LIVGQETFGKGSVQTVFPLEGDHGLRLTTALYYTPSGRSIQEVGITPDIVVDRAPEPSERASTSKRLRERDLEGHFTHEEADPSDAAGAEPALTDEPPASGEGDVQLMRAIEVLKSWSYFERLRQVEPVVQSASLREPPATPPVVQ
jgi:carboxyl-terminal processing protease